LSLLRVERFLPLVKKLRYWKDRKKLVAEPLFPGYLFVRIDPGQLADVVNTRGVVAFLGPRPFQPWVVPAETIGALKTILSSEVPVDPYPYLKTGRRVRVRRGPLRGLEGILEHRKGSLRVIVSVPVLGRSASAEVDAGDLDIA